MVVKKIIEPRKLQRQNEPSNIKPLVLNSLASGFSFNI